MIELEQVRTVYDRHIGETAHFRVIEPEDMPGAIAACALRTAESVARALTLPWQVVVFFVMPTTADHVDAFGPVKIGADVNGFTWPAAKTPRIYVRADLTVDQTERVVAHELRHLWQGWRGMPAFCSRDELERDAHEFDRTWMVARQL